MRYNLFAPWISACEFGTFEKLLGPAGSLTEAAEKALGHKVVIKRFMVTVWGKTGYLQPEEEYAPLTGKFKQALVHSGYLLISASGVEQLWLQCRVHFSHDLSHTSAGLGCSFGSGIRPHAVQASITNEALLQQQQHCISMRSL